MFYFFSIKTYFWLKKNLFMSFLNLIFYFFFLEFLIIMKKNKNSILFFFMTFSMILYSNFFSLFPYIFSPTSHGCVSFWLALIMWWGPQIYHLLFNLDYFLSHLVPSGTPIFLIPLLILIEFISNNIRPLTLSIRLSANIMAGHLLLSLISSYCSVVSIMFLFFILIFMCILEIGVACIQAYVFSLLTSIYSQELN